MKSKHPPMRQVIIVGVALWLEMMVMAFVLASTDLSSTVSALVWGGVLSASLMFVYWFARRQKEKQHQITT